MPDKNVTGVDQLFRNLTDYHAKVVDTVRTATEIIQAGVVNHARANHNANAHSIGRFVARTGQLEASIIPGSIVFTGDEVRAEVVANADYASFVEGVKPGEANLEFGSSRRKAYPFLGPAIAAHPKKFGATMGQMLKGLRRCTCWTRRS